MATRSPASKAARNASRKPPEEPVVTTTSSGVDVEAVHPARGGRRWPRAARGCRGRRCSPAPAGPEPGGPPPAPGRARASRAGRRPGSAGRRGCGRARRPRPAGPSRGRAGRPHGSPRGAGRWERTRRHASRTEPPACDGGHGSNGLWRAPHLARDGGARGAIPPMNAAVLVHPPARAAASCARVHPASIVGRGPRPPPRMGDRRPCDAEVTRELLTPTRWTASFWWARW